MGVTGTEPVRVAIVGAGAMAAEHARAFAAVPGVRLVGITSRTAARAEALAATAGIAGVHADVDALWTATQAHLVVVTVDETSMREVAAAVLAHPWAVLLEKPPGMDAGEARALDDEATARGRSAYVALNRRHLSSTRAALDALRDDPDPRHIVVQDQQSIEEARSHGHPEAVVERWMYANSIHLVDYLHTFGRGEVVEVERLTPWPVEPPGVLLARIRFSSGDTGLYEGLWDAPGPWAVAVTTRRARWELRPLEQATVQLRGQRSRAEQPVATADLELKPGFLVQAEQVVAAVRGEPSTAPTLAEGRRSMELVEAIYDLG